MALSEELPLYRDTYRLLNNLLILTQDFPRFFRYSMGSRMVDLTLDMLSLIYKANSSYEKVGVLTEFLDRYRMLQMLFRVCVEQKVITERKYASFGLLLEKIGKQATRKRVVGRLSSCREARKDKNRQHLLVLLGVLQQSGEQRSLCECEQRQREQQQ